MNFHNERISEFLSLVELNEDRGIITSDFGTTIEVSVVISRLNFNFQSANFYS